MLLPPLLLLARAALPLDPPPKALPPLDGDDAVWLPTLLPPPPLGLAPAFPLPDLAPAAPPPGLVPAPAPPALPPAPPGLAPAPPGLAPAPPGLAPVPAPPVRAAVPAPPAPALAPAPAPAVRVAVPAPPAPGRLLPPYLLAVDLFAYGVPPRCCGLCCHWLPWPAVLRLTFLL